ncbi:NAD(P)-dependent oxidoreductase [Streptomyces sp. NPDC001530]|uniref:NAD(P)-dependent oxidoreductase n=1 Tax=Streptomyces sp. NPDC001530 TaxID=3364582 RepID=UPI0036BA5FD7
MKDGATVWLPYHRNKIPGLPDGSPTPTGTEPARCPATPHTSASSSASRRPVPNASCAGRVHGAAKLPALLPTVDAVVLCAPLTDGTRGMFGADALALLKDGALLVNVARGELVDTRAVVREVREGRLRVALDVTDPEPLPAGHPLWSLPGALITPHVAAFTDAFPTLTTDFLRRQLHRYERGEELHNVVVTTTPAEGGEQAA